MQAQTSGRSIVFPAIVWLSLGLSACGGGSGASGSYTGTYGSARSLSGNGPPNHAVGAFPNAGNPNTFSPQIVTGTATLTPVLGTSTKSVGGPGGANAHLLPKQNATLNIVEHSAYLVLCLAVSALNGVDDDRNGLLSPQELQNHTMDIELQVARHLQASAEGMVGMPVLTMVTAPHTDGTIADSDYIIAMHRINFPRVPDKPGITTNNS